MSILDAYDPAREAVLEPSHAAAPVEGFPETVVVTFQPSLTQAAAGWPGTRVLGHLPVFFRSPSTPSIIRTRPSASTRPCWEAPPPPV